MKSSDSSEVFCVTFPSVEEFRRTFTRRGEDVGVFVPSKSDVSVGSFVILKLGVKGQAQRVPLRALVTMRRARPAGPELPAGLFLALQAQDRDRVEGIAKFFSLSDKLRDRRKHQRLPLLVSARYRTDRGEFDSSTRDLSRGGAFLHCQGPLLQVGARFPLRLFLQEYEGKEVELEAEVAWVDVLQSSKGMGVAFVSRSAPLRQLSRTLKRLEKDFQSA